MPSPLPVLRIDDRAYARTLACVHCGLCLPACPTYLETGNEADSPRGRIQLVRGLADGRIQPTEIVREHLDLCLDCRACETACPSNVIYHEIIEEARVRLTQRFGLEKPGRLTRWLIFNVVTHSTRLKFGVLAARLLRVLSLDRLLSPPLRGMVRAIPAGSMWPKALPKSAGAGTKAKVALIAGCVGTAMFDTLNRKSVELLAASGAQVFVVPANCCGAIHYHNGQRPPAEELAKRNIDAVEKLGVEFIASTAAGCGAMLREYDLLLRDDSNYAAPAKNFAHRVRDISEVLSILGLPPMKNSVAVTVTYHDACHLAHAQKVKSAPRQLLTQIPGLRLVPLPESDLCCGAAGTYYLTHNEMAVRLAKRKLQNIRKTGATICVAANAGCALHLLSQADAAGEKLTVVHPVDLLHAAAFGGEFC
jgi:glycolate oxidase iron-sulfur subunit